MCPYPHPYAVIKKTEPQYTKISVAQPDLRVHHTQPSAHCLLFSFVAEWATCLLWTNQLRNFCVISSHGIVFGVPCLLSLDGVVALL